MAEYWLSGFSDTTVLLLVDVLSQDEQTATRTVRVRIYSKNHARKNWDDQESNYDRRYYYENFNADITVGRDNLTYRINPRGVQNPDLTTFLRHNNPTGLLYDKELVIPYGENKVEADGVESVPVSIKMYAGSTTNRRLLHGVSTTFSLPAIPYRPTVSFSGNVIGAPVVVSIEQRIQLARHRVTWAFGSLSGVIGEEVADSVSWTPSIDQFAPALPNLTSGMLQVRVETFVNGTKLGEYVFEHSLRLPDSVRPDLSGLTLTDGNGKASALQLGNNRFVQQESTIRVRFDGANGVKGSSVISYRAELYRFVNGQWQKTPLSTTSNNGFIGNANFSGRAKVVGYVTDSRGRQSLIREVEVTFLEYHPPVLSFRAERTGADNTRVNVSRHLRIAPLMVDNRQKNVANLTFDVVDIQTEQRTNNIGGAANWTGRTEYEKVNWEGTLDGAYHVGKSFLFIGHLSDTFHTASFEYRVGVEALPASISRYGMGIGKEWTRGVLDVGGSADKPAYFDCDIFVYDNPIQMHALTGRDGQNLNTATNPDLITKAGFYYLLNGPGRPNGRNGYLLVQQYNTDSNYITQLYIDASDGRIYTRIRNNGTWRPWKQLATTDLIGSQKQKLSEDNGVAIQVTGDWNNVTTTGFYRGSGLANQPSKAGAHSWYYVRVTGHDAGRTWVLQEAVDFNGVGSWYRVKVNNVWQPWKEYIVAPERIDWTSTGAAGVHYKVNGEVVSVRINKTRFATSSESMGVIPTRYLPIQGVVSKFQTPNGQLNIATNGAMTMQNITSTSGVITQITWQI